MPAISSVLEADHRRADALFDSAVRAAEQEDWGECQIQFDSFVAALKHHMQIEEVVLFPAFEQASGMLQGPTEVMRREHQEMLALLEEMAGLLEDRNANDFRTLAQAFAQIMNAHSMKEERVLYPMCDRLMPDFDTDQFGLTLTER